MSGNVISFAHIGSTGATGVYSATVPGNAHSVIVSARQATAYVTFDGSTPAAATGHVIPLNLMPAELPVSPGGAVKMLSVTGGTGTAASLLDLTFIGV